MYELSKAFKEIKDRMNAIEQKISQYIDGVHGQSTEGIRESESTIVDLEIELAQLDARVTALEEKESE
jgi:hypothetical protein